MTGAICPDLLLEQLNFLRGRSAAGSRDIAAHCGGMNVTLLFHDVAFVDLIYMFPD
jgi:hypothetical protein